jgi:hypothetical protein
MFILVWESSTGVISVCLLGSRGAPLELPWLIWKPRALGFGYGAIQRNQRTTKRAVVAAAAGGGGGGLVKIKIQMVLLLQWQN